MTQHGLRVGLVGPCTAGKSTLADKLIRLGINVRQIAQEHSYVPYMWRRIGKPDILIFLDVSFKISQERKYLNWTQAEYETQQNRLLHAKNHSDFYLNTDEFTPDQVFTIVVEFLNKHLGKLN